MVISVRRSSAKFNELATLPQDVNSQENSVLLQFQGKVYTITDVHELHVWMKDHFNNHQLFRELEPKEYVCLLH